MTTDIQTLTTGDQIEREGITLTVNQVSYAKGTTVEEAIAKTGERERIIATQDGRGLIEELEREAIDGAEELYFSVERADGTGYHGWLNAETRRIAQVG